MGTSAEKHARQKERRDRLGEARQQVEAAARRRRILAIVGTLVVLVVAVGLVLMVTSDDDDELVGDGTPTTLDPTEAPGPAELPPPPEGITLTEETPCPPAEGAEQRVQAFAGPPPDCLTPGAAYTATFSTTLGDFTAELAVDRAPITVNNFVVLSRYGYYDGVPFHRIVPGFVIQAGDGDGEPWGSNDLGYTIPDELPESTEDYVDYSLAMANAGPDSGSSQFFVVLPGGGGNLEPLYSLFGRVVEGQQIVDAIGALGGPMEEPLEAVLIDSITISETPA